MIMKRLNNKNKNKNKNKNNMGVKAGIIADSVNEFGNRITSFVVTFPRMILAEFNTHRMLSKNSASSRAIPFETMLESAQNNPFIPIAWQKEHKGMQGTEYFINELDIITNQDLWLKGRDAALNSAIGLNAMHVTKQLCNRLLEPFLWHTVIVTGTEWENFFALRCPKYSLFYEQIPMEFRSKKDLLNFVKKVESPEFSKQYDNLSQLEWLQCNKGQAEIHIMALAEAMWDAMNENTPKELKAGEWHIPFGDSFDEKRLTALADHAPVSSMIPEHLKDIEELKIKIATARCARVSYLNYDGNDDYNADIKLYERLSGMGHWSPFEHCAKAMTEFEYHTKVNGTIDKTYDDTCKLSDQTDKSIYGWSGNFRGFVQLRKTFANENIIPLNTGLTRLVTE